MSAPRRGGGLLRGGTLAVLALGLLAPVALGLWETARAAFGVLPAVGAETPSLDAWRGLVAQPGFATSLRLTLVTGLGSTALALLLAVGLCAALHGRWGAGRLGRLVAPLLAAPHAALAIGLAFLIAPSGWIARALSPWATGWERPPDLAIVGDPWGAALILGLLVKEVPFLVLVTLSALAQLPVRAQLMAGRALGYGRLEVWAKVILPQVYPLIRLPNFVVLAFALSVVDMAIILGPSTPPTLAVRVLRGFGAPDTRLILPASAAAILVGALVAGGIALWWLGERALAHLGRAWARAGARRGAAPALRASASLGLALLALGGLALLVLGVWSVAWRWSFPAVLPERWSLQGWSDPGAGWGEAAAATALIAGASTLIALALAIAWLEGEDRGGVRRPALTGLLALPLLLPQVAFLFGLNIAALRAGVPVGLAPVIWVHAVFVFPYVLLALADPWRALDRRLLSTAAALGASPWRRLAAIKLPILLRPILTASAIGFAVSTAQYLPTLVIGAGRVRTLTTEAVALASGSDRRVAALYGLLQAALPLGVYALALMIPAWAWRNRRALSGQSA